MYTIKPKTIHPIKDLNIFIEFNLKFVLRLQQLKNDSQINRKQKEAKEHFFDILKKERNKKRKKKEKEELKEKKTKKLMGPFLSSSQY